MRLLGAMGLAGFFGGHGNVSIPSHQIDLQRPKKAAWAKRDIQRMKGKAARKNRGRNRAKYRRLYEQMH